MEASALSFVAPKYHSKLTRWISLHRCRLFLTATLRIRRKLAAHNKANCEENPSNNLPRYSSVTESQEDYLTQVFQEIEGRGTKKLSTGFGRPESRIQGAFFRLDEFLLKAFIYFHSGSAPETSRNAPKVNQRRNEENSQVDLHQKTRVPQSQKTHVFGPDDYYVIMTGVQKEIFFFAHLGHIQENKRRCAQQISHNFAVRTAFRYFRLTRFCWPFNDWQVKANLPLILVNNNFNRGSKWPNASQQQCP